MNDIIKGYELAEKELKKEKEEELKNKIKGIVRETLEKIDKIDKQEKELAEQKRILKKDIDELKSGRLDLIEERHKESEKARNISVFRVVLKEIQYPPQYCTFSVSPTWYVGGGTCTISGLQTSTYTSGTYTINGQTKFL